MNIKKNDIVVVLSGSSKGRRGRVLQVDRKKDRVLVEGVNMIKRHTRASARNQQGGIVERENYIHISKVMPWCADANRPSKIVRKQMADGKRLRAYKVTGETLNE